MKIVKEIISDLLHTLFPDVCLACSSHPKAKDTKFCISCLHDMPYSDHFLVKNNTVTNHFRVRFPLHHGAAVLRFREGSFVQHMLHQLKYKGRHEIGEIMGQIAAEKMMQSPLFDKPDIILPIPLHYKKKLARGYNQSAVFGKGIEKHSNIPCRDDIITKSKNTVSQTGKSRTDRVINVADAFEVSDRSLIAQKHILIVDDIVTTGATLEACCIKVLEAGASKISIICNASSRIIIIF